MIDHLSTDPRLDDVLMDDPVVAIGVSGGKDSQASALAVNAHLDALGHHGERVLIHSDLGMVEWNQSLTICEELAEHLGMELIVVRRKAGGMMERWEQRWQSSKTRYAALETTSVVLPWSTPSMRFCTSELKTQVIMPALKRRFKGQTIINVTGIRREESAARAKSVAADYDQRWSSGDTHFWNWRPILDWSTPEVFTYIRAMGLRLHPAYTDFGMSRVSCAFCIMSNSADMMAATTAAENHDLYRRMVALEIESTFGFQGNRWLADMAPHLLTEDLLDALPGAREKAGQRVVIEKEIPKAARLSRGKPVEMISYSDAGALAQVRREIAGLYGWDIAHTDADAVHAHYARHFEGAVGGERERKCG